MSPAKVAPPFLIGLTGCIGSGKSSVAAALCEPSEVCCLDADQVCRQLLEPGEPGWQAVRSEFGAAFLDGEGRIDRARLREKIFSDEPFRLKLNSLVHPLAWRMIESRIAQAMRERKEERFIIEVPLLYEAGWENFFRKIVMVYATPGVCVERLMKRDGVTRQEALAALAAQWPGERKARLADYVIDNSGVWPETCLQLHQLQRLLWAEEG